MNSLTIRTQVTFPEFEIRNWFFSLLFIPLICHWDGELIKSYLLTQTNEGTKMFQAAIKPLDEPTLGYRTLVGLYQRFKTISSSCPRAGNCATYANNNRFWISWASGKGIWKTHMRIRLFVWLGDFFLTHWFPLSRRNWSRTSNFNPFATCVLYVKISVESTAFIWLLFCENLRKNAEKRGKTRKIVKKILVVFYVTNQCH